MKRGIVIFLLALLLCGCEREKESSQMIYKNITQQEAKEIMDTQGGYVILDVREQEEYDEGHIPNAICISYLELEEKAEDVLTDKDQMLLVYCRSGRRSKIGAQTLVELGYTHVLEFGGILDWPYEIVK